MANPLRFTPIKPHFFQPLLPGFQHHLTIPVAFFMKYIEGRNLGKKAKLRSDASDRTWEVKIDGRKLSGGWEEFAVAHALHIGDVIVFRHEGNLVFHVTGFGPSCCEIQYALFRLDGGRNVIGVEDEIDEDVIGIEDEIDEDVTGLEDEIDVDVTGDLSTKKKVKSSSNHSFFRAAVTASGLRADTLFLPRGFVRSNCLNDKRYDEVVLMNEHGRSWTLNLGHAKSRDTTVYITRGWRSFCRENGLKVGGYFTFKLVQNETKLLLQLSHAKSFSSHTRSKEKSGSGECSKRKEKYQQ